jgi:hypothetical protein
MEPWKKAFVGSSGLIMATMAPAGAAGISVNPQTCQVPQVCADVNTVLGTVLNPYTVQLNTIATLTFSCKATQIGQIYFATDLSAGSIVYNGAVTTSNSSATALVVCNGVNWIMH